ncbi:hypothetical protein EHI8A_218680 [Entamoeba histolytica HM-1:IMSS-B]|uniref:Uncharacterized protein n=6 Tax=Entamoeba histolytica TaxID=5759 RepID=C4LT98_ENTH1|nr:hypothetical protein EHI_044790 [Entamoeba histolytica HM-1:IMSS]EMD45639.1 Hypothetical protein EHI5A_101060 [Entamoeba histolytica KU27]EMH77582.1 hypothetical protein EHI8A_218680 [Entamoeba histolytica HM-1:IMSS-B]EMS15304.1 hypothetical protein KM1_022140 [Entamoeba histolytica HM-3:IMSS]ENY60004.1 hypothetical protein EHI7A_068590 [Entamoeba histolytica HM-1:IMSS-A]GAT91776.1 hypothetical protein CL6EHI_044790 [Entamoeba histolytica]|eukprot:XP_657217.1 hypothetical protein EHI_044790 [Entamoeba histolytica HM-1:IMSS]
MQLQMSCSHDQLMELIRLRNAINSRKEECADLEAKISNILSQKSEGTTLSEKLQRLEELQLKRIELQSRKQTLMKQNEDLKIFIEGESQKLMKSVELMEKVQKKEMKEVLENSVQVLSIAEELERQHKELQNKVFQLKKELINQLKKIYSLKQRLDDKLTQPIMLLNGVVIPNKIGSQELELMNEVYGDIAHIINLLARYFDVSLKYPLHPNAMYSLISVRGKQQQTLPLYSKTVNQQAYRTALTYLNYDIDQLLLYFGTEQWEAAAHAQPIEKVYSIYQCCDKCFNTTDTTE